MTKINLGCGWRNFGSDWVHIDGGDYEHLDHDDIFDFPYENVDLIYASHVIEYFNREEIIPILRNWRSKLKPGGILRLAVPNFATLCAIYMRGNPVEKVLGPLYGQMSMGDETIYHRTTYDEPSLRTMLVAGGFTGIRYWDWRSVDHGKYDDHSQAYFPHMDKENGTHLSLNLEGVNNVF